MLLFLFIYLTPLLLFLDTYIVVAPSEVKSSVLVIRYHTMYPSSHADAGVHSTRRDTTLIPASLQVGMICRLRICWHLLVWCHRGAKEIEIYSYTLSLRELCKAVKAVKLKSFKRIWPSAIDGKTKKLRRDDMSLSGDFNKACGTDQRVS